MSGMIPDPCDLRFLTPRLEAAGFRFDKNMGQNFVIDPSVPEDLADAAQCDGKAVLEIGPGAGALTCRLAARAAKVAAIELDKRIIPVLSGFLEGRDNVSIVRGDAMSLDLAQLCSREFEGLGTPMVCANLPYNITADILEKLTGCGLFSRLTVMIQREVADKLLSQPGDSRWCHFAALMQYRAETRFVRTVEAQCFCPAPHVTSAIVRLDLREEPPVHTEDEAWFLKVLSGAFHLRRKTFVNSLNAALGIPKAQISAALEALGLSPTVRGEALPLSQLAQIADALRP